MRICIITARIPPSHCGVGDYSVQLAHELVSQGHEVTLICGKEQAGTSDEPGIRIRNVVSSWGIFGIRSLLAELPLRKPDLILVNWVPHLYAPKGTNLGLALAMVLAKIDGARIHTIVHEPYVELTRPSFFITGPIQRLALGILTWCSAAVLVTIQPWVQMLKAKYKKAADKIFWVPVGSNIPVAPVTVTERDHYRSELGMVPTDVALGVFSLGGAGKDLPCLTEAMKAMNKARIPCFWIFIGVTDEEFAEKFPKLKNVPHYCTGYLATETVSRWLQSIDLFVAAFDDGVSTRRTSVIAALAHGVPTVTTVGHLTDHAFYEMSPLILTSLDPTEFASHVVRAAQNLSSLRTGRPEIREFYKSWFRWKDIATSLLSPRAPAKTSKAASLQDPNYPSDLAS